MADTPTTHYGWTKPENGASLDSWGIKWNDNLDDIDSDLKEVADDLAALDTAACKKADNLSGLNNYGTARTNLGLTIGTDVQAYHAILASLAGSGGTSGTFPYFSGANAISLAAISSQGRDFLTDTTAAAQRSRIGLGNVNNYGIFVTSSDPGGVAVDSIWMW